MCLNVGCEREGIGVKLFRGGLVAGHGLIMEAQGPIVWVIPEGGR
jgi:hypothetical protein